MQASCGLVRQAGNEPRTSSWWQARWQARASVSLGRSRCRRLAVLYWQPTSSWLGGAGLQAVEILQVLGAGGGADPLVQPPCGVLVLQHLAVRR